MSGRGVEGDPCLRRELRVGRKKFALLSLVQKRGGKKCAAKKLGHTTTKERGEKD